MINLLGPELLPEKPLLTLSRVVTLWAVVLVVMVAMSIISSVHLKEVTEDHKIATAKNKLNKDKLSNLERELGANRVDKELSSRLALLKLTMKNKKNLLQQLTDPKRTYVKGFSSAMSDLSAHHHNEISLQQVIITNDELTFAGFARSPEAVPAWLAGFEQSALLSGKSFINFKLEENEDKVTSFVVSSVTTSKEP